MHLREYFFVIPACQSSRGLQRSDRQAQRLSGEPSRSFLRPWTCDSAGESTCPRRSGAPRAKGRGALRQCVGSVGHSRRERPLSAAALVMAFGGGACDGEEAGDEAWARRFSSA